MSYHIYQHYTFNTDLSSELLLSNNPEIILLRNLQFQLQLRQNASLSPIIFSTSNPINLNSLPIIPWNPSTKFLKLLNNFNLIILNQFPCALCTFCGRLMYSLKCEQLPYDDNYSYFLLNAYPEHQAESLLIFHVKLPKHIATCLSYKKPNTRYAFLLLHLILNEIQAVSLKK